MTDRVHTLFQHQRAHCCLLLCLMLGVFAGCGARQDGLSQRFPVEGQVLLEGQPVAEATVVFHPAAETPGLPRPQAQTDADGRYRLTTLETNDGAVPGNYKITVELRELTIVGEEQVRDGRHLLPTRYAQPATSDLAYTVAPGPNVVPPLDLKRR